MTTTLRLHYRQDLMTGEHHCQHVDIKHLPPLPGISALDLAKQHYACVIHHDIDASKGLFGPVDRLTQLGFVHQIDNDWYCLAARILDPLHDHFQTIRAPGKHRDARPPPPARSQLPRRYRTTPRSLTR